MLVPSPTQAVAVLDWLLATLNTDDEGAAIVDAPFTSATVFPGERDHPTAARWARLNTIAIVGRGLVRSHEVIQPEEEEDPTTLQERRSELREWTCSITVRSMLDPTARLLSDSAGIHLQRALGAFHGAAAVPLRAVGVSPIRRGEMQDVSRLSRGTEWDTRASATVTWLCGWTATTPVNWLERLIGEGAIEGQDPLGFDTAEGA